MTEPGAPSVSPLALWAVHLQVIYFFFRFLFSCTCQAYRDHVYLRISTQINFIFSQENSSPHALSLKPHPLHGTGPQSCLPCPPPVRGRPQDGGSGENAQEPQGAVKGVSKGLAWCYRRERVTM